MFIGKDQCTCEEEGGDKLMPRVRMRGLEGEGAHEARDGVGLGHLLACPRQLLRVRAITRSLIRTLSSRPQPMRLPALPLPATPLPASGPDPSRAR